MDIKLHEITIRDLFQGYVDEGETGVFGYDGKLSIRPAYQREFVYSKKDEKAVINSVYNDFPLNVMYWMIAERDAEGQPTRFELLDGQQRTLSICHFLEGGKVDIEINGSPKFFNNLTAEQQKKILDYELMVYWCDGTDEERLEWFKTINIAGAELTNQEIRNAVYVGPFITNAKRYFSKNGCYAYNLGKNYLSGDMKRQDYLQTILRWASDKDGVGSIEEYMALHQFDPDATYLKDYFTDIIEWIESLFKYESHMKGIEWGLLYNKYHNKSYDPSELQNAVTKLLIDDEVTKKSGIYEYLLGGKKDEKLLSLRAFELGDKRRQYAKQNGICPACNKHFEFEEMHADHIVPWSQGGKTVPDNLQMLCAHCNLQKKNQTANFV